MDRGPRLYQHYPALPASALSLRPSPSSKILVLGTQILTENVQIKEEKGGSGFRSAYQNVILSVTYTTTTFKPPRGSQYVVQNPRLDL